MKTPHGYTKYYCEENIYKLLTHPEDNIEESYSIFITNSINRVIVENHNFSNFDYHVIAMVKYKEDDTYYILDFDSLKEFKQPLIDYINIHFTNTTSIPMFRVVPKDIMLSDFKTNRSHMTKPELGVPSWEKLHESTNLTLFIDVKEIINGTTIYNIKELIKKYGK